jgi:glutaryl-CoA dehydrogenase (non-decarboxylating)
MSILLSAEQRGRQAEFRDFVSRVVAPIADAFDREGRIPDDVIEAYAKAGYLGISIPAAYGGGGQDTVTWGLLNEATGWASASLTDLLTVQAMVAMTVLKWGTERQKEQWLPRLARGEVIGAFALTEPGGGSSLEKMETLFRKAPDGYVLNGRKRWISYAQQAGVFLVVGQCEGLSMACLLPRDAAGLRIEPMRDLMGYRSAGLGEVVFEDVRVPAEQVVGKPGFATSHVAPVGLQYGRISTANSALGLLRACFEMSARYAGGRKVGGRAIGELGLIRSKIAQMGIDLEAGQSLCYMAARAADERVPEAFEKALIAKRFTSVAAVRAAADAIQIHGAAGILETSPLARIYRDAKITEIIEGTTEVHDDILGRIFQDQARGSRP